MKIQKKLLIIGCSKRKREFQDAPAIDVYDGPYYRMLRKAKLESVDILILSAKYGLIDYRTKISPYQRKITPNIAEEIRDSVTTQLKNLLRENSYDEIVINLGKIYLTAFDFRSLSQYGKTFKILSGDILMRIRTLKRWITENSGDV